MNTLNWIDLHGLLNLLSCINQDYLPNWGTTHNGFDPPSSIINQRMSYRLAYISGYWGHFLDWESVFQITLPSISWQKNLTRIEWLLDPYLNGSSVPPAHHSCMHFCSSFIVLGNVDYVEAAMLHKGETPSINSGKPSIFLGWNLLVMCSFKILTFCQPFIRAPIRAHQDHWLIKVDSGIVTLVCHWYLIWNKQTFVCITSEKLFMHGVSWEFQGRW